MIASKKSEMIKYIENDRCFSIYTPRGNAICDQRIEIINEYNPHDFEMYILYNCNACENSIFQVKLDKSDRVGWIFPFQALMSDKHSFADNPHFLKQAYIAYCLLLDNIYDDIIESESFEIQLEDYYDSMSKSNVQILLLEKELVNDAVGKFDINMYIPSLLAYGYTVKNEDIRSRDFAEIDTFIKLKRISKEIENNPYIISLFLDLIPSSMDELARFHILYQAIEVMITVIFQNDFKKFVESLSDSDSINYLSEKEEVLKEMMGEKGRVKKLINQYTNVSSKKKTNLDNACTELLNSVQFPYKNGNQLYGCRCLLVHNMYRINPEDRNRIKEINDFFMDVLIEMVQTFEIH